MSQRLCLDSVQIFRIVLDNPGHFEVVRLPVSEKLIVSTLRQLPFAL